MGYWLWVWEKKGEGWDVRGLFNTKKEAETFFNYYFPSKLFGHDITE